MICGTARSISKVTAFQRRPVFSWLLVPVFWEEFIIIQAAFTKFTLEWADDPFLEELIIIQAAFTKFLSGSLLTFRRGLHALSVWT